MVPPPPPNSLMCEAPFSPEQVVHVFEVFHVAALVARHRNGVGIFLDRTVHHFLHAAVVPQVDHLRPRGLNDAPHDVDGGIVSVKRSGGRNDAYFVGGLVWCYFLHSSCCFSMRQI